MPQAALRPCVRCGVLCKTGRCDAHRRVEAKAYDQQRGTAAQRGYGARWQKARAGWLRSHPLCQCEECQEGKLRTLIATVVDHVKPHRGDMKLFWDSSNWQSMAKPCHDKKTAREDGGFGNRGRGG